MLLGADRLELDVCVTADGVLILRHDTRLGPRAVRQLPLRELRQVEPALLTLDEGLEHLGDGVPVMLDIKSRGTGPHLGRWLAPRRDRERFAVCTESAGCLLEVRERAPRVERWRSLPDLGHRRSHRVTRVLAGLWQQRRPVHLALAARRIGGAVTRLPLSPLDSLGLVAGVPWRRQLPAELPRLVAEVGASGLCVHHSLVSDEVVWASARLGLPVATWTVNRPALARAVARCGVDLIITDRLGAPWDVRTATPVTPAPAPPR